MKGCVPIAILVIFLIFAFLICICNYLNVSNLLKKYLDIFKDTNSGKYDKLALVGCFTLPAFVGLIFIYYKVRMDFEDLLVFMSIFSAVFMSFIGVILSIRERIRGLDSMQIDSNTYIITTRVVNNLFYVNLCEILSSFVVILICLFMRFDYSGVAFLSKSIKIILKNFGNFLILYLLVLQILTMLMIVKRLYALFSKIEEAEK